MSGIIFDQTEIFNIFSASISHGQKESSAD